MAKFNNLTCLIADDYGTARRIIKDTMQELGFNCLEAGNGEHALSLLHENKVDLVMADNNMPIKSGMELLEEIKADANLKEIPFLLMFIEPFEDLVNQGNSLGMSDFITKPFDVFILSKILDKIVIKTD